MTDPANTQLLHAICKHGDRRRVTLHPWSVAIDGRMYAVATDGVRILCLDGEGEFPPAPDDKLRAHIESAPRATHQVDEASLAATVGVAPAVCPGCQNAPQPMCAACDGIGEIRCSLGHYHTCPKCDGEGKKDTCTGAGPHFDRHEFQAVRFGDLPPMIDARRLRGIVTALPGPVTVGGSDQVAALRGPGWLLMVMHMRDTAREPAPRIHTAPIAPAQEHGT